MSDEISYKDSGVDIEVGARAVQKIAATVRSTYTSAVLGDIGGFGGLYSGSDIKGMQDPVLVSATDGVGTKLELARRFNNHSTVGIDLVAMCVNDLVVTGAKPLFFLDYLAVGKLDDEFAAVVIAGIAEGCRDADCALIGGEMAEHPGIMKETDYDLAGFAVGSVERSEMLGQHRVRSGDIVIGLASSGLHSNGYSLVRKAFTDPRSDAELQDNCLADGRSWAEAVMAPTTIYVRAMLALKATIGSGLHAAAHITGGGITENLNRVLPEGLDARVDLGSWPVPEIIELVAGAANLSAEQALKTFNMGIGMTAIVSPDCLDQAMNLLQQFQPVYQIGQIVTQIGEARPGAVVYGDSEQLQMKV